MSWSSGVGTASATVVTTKVYQSNPVNFDSANLATTGVELFTIPTGSIITRMWLELITPFDNVTSVSQDQWELSTNGTDATDFGFSYGLVEDYPNISDSPVAPVGDKLSTVYNSVWQDAIRAPSSGSSSTIQSIPWRVVSDCTFFFKVTFVDDVTYDPPTQGQLYWYALVAEVDA